MPPRTTYSERAQGILSVLADRIVGYHVSLAKVIGVKEAVFVCQLLYWDGKGAKDGVVWKSQKEITDETGLSRTEQETVRKHLVAGGILSETREGVPATMHFRLNFDRLAGVVEAGYYTPVCGNPANWIAETPQTIQENTTLDHSVPGSAEDRIPSMVTQPSLLVNSDEPPPIEANSQCETHSGDCEKLHNADALLPRTPAAEHLFALLSKEAQALHRRPPRKFPSLMLLEQFEAAEQRVGEKRMKALCEAAIKNMGYVKVASLVGYILTSAANGPPARERVNGPMFDALARALRLDPNASEEHAKRLAGLTETVERAGYTTDIVRKAGNNWWEFGWGKQGSLPSDSQFIARLKFVQEERM